MSSQEGGGPVYLPPSSPALRMSEDDLLTYVLDVAKMSGWWSFHARPAKTARGYRTAVQGDGVGFPDLVLVRGPRVMFVELKSDTGTLSAAQQMWQARLRAQEYHLWRPLHQQDGTIARELGLRQQPS